MSRTYRTIPTRVGSKMRVKITAGKDGDYVWKPRRCPKGDKCSACTTANLRSVLRKPTLKQELEHGFYEQRTW